MPDIVIAGGGWAGVGAAVAARMAGTEVALLERTDMLLGTGLVGGIMRNNGRLTAAQEAIALGGGELFAAIDTCLRHRNVSFPGHEHADLYDVALAEPAIRELLTRMGVDVRMRTRVKDARMAGESIAALLTDRREEYTGAVFIDATGTAGPQADCKRYGNGCCACVLRCPVFGGRISVAKLAGVQERMGGRAGGLPGAMSGSCKLFKESLSREIREKLDREGVAVIPVPKALQKGKDLLKAKACQQYALKEFAQNVVLLDTGHAKLMSPYYPLELLRKIPGLERARYEDPYAGGVGNSIRYLALAPRDNALRVKGVNNLFCAGEKAGLLVGHTEAIVTGLLAGHNAARSVKGMPPLLLPRTLAVGDAIAYANEAVDLTEKVTFSGAAYFRRMRELSLYTTDASAICERVAAAGLTDVFSAGL